MQHTHNTHEHTHICGSPEHQHGPSAHLAPLPRSQPLLPILMPPQLARWSSSVLTANTQHSHTRPTCTPHSWVPLCTSTDPARLIAQPGPEAPCSWLVQPELF